MLVTVGILIGILAIILYAIQASGWTQFTSVVGVSTMIGCASLLAGGLVGFLFGIPRTLQQDGVQGPQQPASETATSQDDRQRASYGANTNLEQISDWLTKILVGVGLTQIAQLPQALRKYADYAAVGLGGFQSSEIFALALLIYFAICGFLVGFLATRLKLPGAYAQADLAQLASKVDKLQEQAELDARALSLVQRQLNPGADDSGISQEEMNAAIQAASPPARNQAFFMAQEVRSENWRDWETKPRMARTIRIFRALSDTDDSNHAYHAQLGFALKDQREPDDEEALSELTKAIERRGSWREHGWLFYEFNRAICRIRLDQASRPNLRSDEATKNAIIDDLYSASHAPALDELIQKDATISNWLQFNDVAMESIRSGLPNEPEQLPNEPEQ